VTYDPEGVVLDELRLSWGNRPSRPEVQKGVVEYPAPPSDIVAVDGEVVSVRLPMLNSPSVAGERASVSIRVSPGSVPAFPEMRMVTIRFDPYANPFRKGQKQVLLFLPNGMFWGIDGVRF
jgi:hypothetical protein